MNTCESCGYIEPDEGAEEVFCCDCKPKIKINLDEALKQTLTQLSEKG